MIKSERVKPNQAKLVEVKAWASDQASEPAHSQVREQARK